MEVLITVLLAGLSIFILVKNIKNKASGGGCNCGSCSSHCPLYKETNNTDDKEKTEK